MGKVSNGMMLLHQLKLFILLFLKNPFARATMNNMKYLIELIN